MARNDDMQLYEPEGLDPESALEGDARAHRDLHLALEQAGAEWKEKGKIHLSAKFDERLLERIDRDREFQIEDRQFDPVVGAGESPFFNRRGFLAATAAVFFVFSGIVWFQAYQQTRSPEAPGIQQKSSAEAPADTWKEAHSVAPARDSGRSENEAGPMSLPAPGRPPTERAGAVPMVAPTAPESERETQKRSAWSEDSTPDAETLLREQIAAEKDPGRKKDLMKQLLRLYETGGQRQKAADIRRQLQSP